MFVVINVCWHETSLFVLGVYETKELADKAITEYEIECDVEDQENIKECYNQWIVEKV
jgi:hypothetical protein